MLVLWMLVEKDVFIYCWVLGLMGKVIVFRNLRTERFLKVGWFDFYLGFDVF